MENTTKEQEFQNREKKSRNAFIAYILFVLLCAIDIISIVATAVNYIKKSNIDLIDFLVTPFILGWFGLLIILTIIMYRAIKGQKDFNYKLHNKENKMSQTVKKVAIDIQVELGSIKKSIPLVESLCDTFARNSDIEDIESVFTLLISKDIENIKKSMQKIENSLQKIAG